MPGLFFIDATYLYLPNLAVLALRAYWRVVVACVVALAVSCYVFWPW